MRPVQKILYNLHAVFMSVKYFFIIKYYRQRRKGRKERKRRNHDLKIIVFTPFYIILRV